MMFIEKANLMAGEIHAELLLFLKKHIEEGMKHFWYSIARY